MSHELRTPLNSLLILARLLADNAEQNLSAKQVEFAQAIHKAGSDLLLLIDEILDLSKVEAGRAEVQPSEVSITQLVDYVEATFRPVTGEQGLAFTVDVSPDIPGTLWTDEQRLQQILRNLLSNAVKFTDPGGAIKVSLRLVGGKAVVSVADTGCGIDSRTGARIFEKFYQGDTSHAGEGNGLGLALVKKVIDVLGGEIHVESAKGKGSVFTVSLPAVNR